ncbi:hypothetical protein CW304_18795 [Bacillus sp. UFRGS-B20]|nr:hypothetical protein CW304_18795 [Bacillus sp. UFRGS-B20]
MFVGACDGHVMSFWVFGNWCSTGGSFVLTFDYISKERFLLYRCLLLILKFCLLVFIPPIGL